MISLVADGVWLLLLLAALWAAGDLVVHAAGPRCPAIARQPAGTVALGMGAWSLAMFGLAATERLQRPWIQMLFWLAVAWAAWRGLRSRRRLAAGLPRPARPGPLWAAAALMAYTGVMAFLLAAAPTIGWDDAVYHLRLPALYLAHGGFRWVRFSIESHWPQDGEMLFALAMALRGFVLAKLLHFAAGALTLWTAYRIARRQVSPAAAIAVPLLLLATPGFLANARVAYVDLFVMLFVTLAFDALLRAHAGEQRAAHLVAAGSLLGLAASTKLTAWLAVAALMLVWAVAAWRRRESLRALAGQLALLALPALALVLPWHLKAWWETGNPVYPLAYGVFGGVEWSAELTARAAEMHRAIGMGRGLMDYVLLPIRVFVSGGQRYESFGGVLGAHWLAALPLVVFAACRPGVGRIAAAAAGGYFILWAAGPQMARYYLPALPFLAIAAAAGADQFAAGRRRLRTGLLLAALGAVALALNLQEPTRQAIAELRAVPQRAGPAQVRNPSPALVYLETETAAGAKVLFLNNNRVFPLTREAVADSMFEASQIAEWLRPAKTVDEVGELFGREGITHVLLERVDWRIDWPPALFQLLEDGERSRQVFATRDGRFAVYELIRR